jgi:hypothetical protein
MDHLIYNCFKLFSCIRNFVPMGIYKLALGSRAFRYPTGYAPTNFKLTTSEPYLAPRSRSIQKHAGVRIVGIDKSFTDWDAKIVETE